MIFGYLFQIVKLHLEAQNFELSRVIFITLKEKYKFRSLFGDLGTNILTMEFLRDAIRLLENHMRQHYYHSSKRFNVYYRQQSESECMIILTVFCQKPT